MERIARGTALAAVAVSACALLMGCDLDPGETPAATTVIVATQAPADISASEVEPAPTAQPPAPPPRPGLALGQTPADAHPVVWVRAGARVAMRSAPGGGQVVEWVGRRTRFGSPSVFGVLERRGDWAAVSSERLPNGEPGWIELDPSRLDAGWTRYSIEVDLSERTVALMLGDELERTFPVTVGAPVSSTPTGEFSVTDTFTDLGSDAYGCCALALSATQPNLPSGWFGGDRIAIHGTDGALGVAGSAGCVRADDADVASLVETVPLGTPVIVRA